MKTPSELEHLLEQAPRPQAPAGLLATLERQIKLPAVRPVQRTSWLSWRRIWIPLSALGATAALAASLAAFRPAGAGQESLQVSLISASEDRAGTWGVFKPGLGDDNGNGVAIANDWAWKAALRLNSSKSIKTIQILQKNSNQIWTTADPIHWPLVVFSQQEQLNHGYREVLGPFAAGTHQLDLYGQVDNRKMYGTDLRIEFTDGTWLSAEIPRSAITVGQGSQRPALAPEAPAPVIYGNPKASNATRLIVDVYPEPVITRLNILDNGQISIEAKGVPGQAYALESASSLTPPVAWQPIATNSAGTDGMFGFFDTKTTNTPACFYRLRLPVVK